MTTMTRDALKQFHMLKYVGSDPTLEHGRLYDTPLEIAPDKPLFVWNGNDLVEAEASDFTAPDPIPYSHGTFTILSSARHRNGIGGEPFVVALVQMTPRTDDEPSRRMLVTMFETPYTVSAVDLDVAHGGDIRFGFNSYRGEHFETLRPTLYPNAQ